MGSGRAFPRLTRERSKPAVPFGGKYRLVDVPISNCLNGGIRRIFVLTQFNSASLNNHITQHVSLRCVRTQLRRYVLAAEQTPDRERRGFRAPPTPSAPTLRHIVSRTGVEYGC